MQRKLRDYYEVLEVPKTATVEEIRKQYKRLSLIWHPDKNLNNKEEADERFKELQNAYKVLMDPQERQWYDDHKEAILRGVDPMGDDAVPDDMNLWPFFTTSAYTSFEDADEKGFYTVYGKLFADIFEKEEDHLDRKAERAPTFGNSTTSYADVQTFYRFWSNFATSKPFGHVDKYNPNEAPDRQTKRYIEKENKTEREKARKAFNQRVRSLVLFIRKRDRRVLAHVREKSKQEEERKKMDQALKKQRDAESTKERQRLREQHLAELEAEANKEDEEIVLQYLEQVNPRRKKKEARAEGEQREWICHACAKVFKSEKQMQEHEKNKRHIKNMQLYLEHLARQKQASGEASDSDSEEGEGQEANSDAERNGDEGQMEDKLSDAELSDIEGSAQPKPDDSEEDPNQADVGDIASSDLEDVAVVRPSAAPQHNEEGDTAEEEAIAMLKTRPSRKKKQNIIPQTVSDDDESSEEDKGKPKSARAKKKAKQKAAKERKAEKERLESEQALAPPEKPEKAEKPPPKNAKSPAVPVKRTAPQDEDQGDDAERDYTYFEKKKREEHFKAEEESKRTCSVCGDLFESRSKLFQHISETGHAILKDPTQKKRGKR